MVLYGLDMTKLYKCRLLQAYGDYADDLMVPLDLSWYPEVPLWMHSTSLCVPVLRWIPYFLCDSQEL